MPRLPIHSHCDLRYGCPYHLYRCAPDQWDMYCLPLNPLGDLTRYCLYPRTAVSLISSGTGKQGRRHSTASIHSLYYIMYTVYRIPGIIRSHWCTVFTWTQLFISSMTTLDNKLGRPYLYGLRIDHARVAIRPWHLYHQLINDQCTEAGGDRGIVSIRP